MTLFLLFTCALSLEAPLNISDDGTICYGLLDTSYSGPLVIPEGVKIIRERAFNDNKKLTSLKLPQSLEEIQGRAFYLCTGLTGSLIIPDSVTQIGDWAFSSCKSFNGTLTLGKSVTRIGTHAFASCTGFTGSLVIPDSVTEIGQYAFYNCRGFNGTLTLGKKVARIEKYAFYGCSGFTGSLNISDSVTEIGYEAFYSCKGLTEVHVGRQITQIPSYTFYGCSLLKRCFFYNSNVAIQTYAFRQCPELHIFYEVNECKYFTIDSTAFEGSPIMSSNFVCLALLTPTPTPSPTSLFSETMAKHNSHIKPLLEAFFLVSI